MSTVLILSFQVMPGIHAASHLTHTTHENMTALIGSIELGGEHISIVHSAFHSYRHSTLFNMTQFSNIPTTS